MEASVGSLEEALGLGPREHVALVGAGGKTSLMFALAGELSKRKRRVLSSTTTKIWHHEARRAASIHLIKDKASWREELEKGLETEGHVFIGDSLLESGKIEGIGPSLADELFQSRGMDYLLVEADGAAGHPVKAPTEHEPVIPSTTTKVVALMGLEAMGQKLGPESVFRLEHFQKLTGTALGQDLTPHMSFGTAFEIFIYKIFCLSINSICEPCPRYSGTEYTHRASI